MAGILEREATKMGRATGPRAPALFRETALDTHKTAPTEDFGPSYWNGPAINQKYGSATIASGNVNAMRHRAIARAKQQAAQAKTAQQEPVEYRSVFKPRPEQVGGALPFIPAEWVYKWAVSSCRAGTHACNKPPCPSTLRTGACITF